MSLPGAAGLAPWTVLSGCVSVGPLFRSGRIAGV
ncbi:hypothetical protein GGR01_001215 [Acetobacter oeni]|nr:hypothetical protein [Acetobacter oeni]